MMDLYAPIPEWMLLAFGLGVIALELFFLNLFVILFFGLGAVIVGLIGFVFPFGTVFSQLFFIAILGLGGVLFFRKKLINLNTVTLESKQVNPIDTYSKEGVGVISIQNGEAMVKFEGTFWSISQESLKNAYEEGERVNIQLKGNTVTIIS